MRPAYTWLPVAAAATLLALAFGTCHRAPPAPPRPFISVGGVADREVIEACNRLLRPPDSVAFYGGRMGPRRIAMIGDVHGPRRLVSVPSEEAAGRLLQLMPRGSFDMLVYNPEHWASKQLPAAELADPVAAARRVRQLAADHGLEFGYVTDDATLLDQGARVAPFADLVGVQLQRFQRLPLQELRSEAKHRLAAVRSAGPHVPVAAQLSMAPVLWQERGGRRVPRRGPSGRKLTAPLGWRVVLEQARALSEDFQGIALLYDPASREDLLSLLRAMRGREPGG